MLKHDEGLNDDGSVKYRYELTEAEHDEGFAVMMTGPVTGVFRLADGTEYDTTAPHIAVKVEHGPELAYLIHRARHHNGQVGALPGDGSLDAYRTAMLAHTTHMGSDGEPVDGPAPRTPAE